MEKKKIVTQTEKFIELAEKETNSDIKCLSEIGRAHV